MKIELKVNDVFTVEIVDLDSSGRGISKVEGAVIFLDGGLIGDRVRAKITEVKSRYYRGTIIDIITPSKDRIKPKCPYSPKCGGCDFQDLKYTEQLEWKQEFVRKNMIKIGKLNEPVKDIIGMESPFYYRNNMQFQVKNGEIGLFEKNSYNLVAIKKCIIQSERANKILERLYYLKLPKHIKTIAIRTNALDEVMVIIVASQESANYNSILSVLIDENVESIYLNINKSKRHHFSHDFRKICGKDYLVENILNNEFLIYPGIFLQVNKIQTEELYNAAINYLKLNKEDRLLDLYCGIGTISLYASRFVKEVWGVESYEKSVYFARKNAEINNIFNTRFIASKVENIIEKIEEEEETFNKIILDPPRAGCDEKVLKSICRIKPEKISYISCNSATLARDIKYMVERGYSVDTIQPVDMFCHSSHVETIALMSRK